MGVRLDRVGGFGQHFSAPDSGPLPTGMEPVGFARRRAGRPLAHSSQSERIGRPSGERCARSPALLAGELKPHPRIRPKKGT